MKRKKSKIDALMGLDSVVSDIFPTSTKSCKKAKAATLNT